VSAERAARRALELAPGHAGALSNLAFARFDQGDAQGAVALWRQALTGGASADALAGVALGLWQQGQTDAALETYRKAAGLDASYLSAGKLAATHLWSDHAVDAAAPLLDALAPPANGAG
jgi:tetratricopeptide (TPR) repeat protein